MKPIIYAGRTIRYQEQEKVWVFNIRTTEGKWERRVRSTLRAAKEVIAENKGHWVTVFNADDK